MGDISTLVVCSVSFPLGNSCALILVFQVRLLPMELCPSLPSSGHMTQAGAYELFSGTSMHDGDVGEGERRLPSLASPAV